MISKLLLLFSKLDIKFFRLRYIIISLLIPIDYIIQDQKKILFHRENETYSMCVME